MKASASATTTTAISSAMLVFYCANQRSAPVSAMLRMRRLAAHTQSHRPQPARAQCLPLVCAANTAAVPQPRASQVQRVQHAACAPAS